MVVENRTRTSDAAVWAGLLLLLVGLLLLDRSFANWRSDARNFRNADGIYGSPKPGHEGYTFFQRRGVQRLMAVSGLSMMVISVVLLRDLGPGTEGFAGPVDPQAKNLRV